jgi:hypothetical protein
VCGRLRILIYGVEYRPSISNAFVIPSTEGGME